MVKTEEQRRAQSVWDALTGNGRFGPDLQHLQPRPATLARRKLAKQYLTAMRQTATRIHVSGLGQSLAFLRSRDNEGGKLAAEDLASLTLRAMGEPETDQPSLALINLLRQGDLMKLMRATEEVMALIAWGSRYLQGAGVTAGDTEEQAAEGGGPDA